MEVDEAQDRQGLGCAVEEGVGVGERRVELVHEHAAHEVDDGHRLAVGQVMDQPAAAGRVVGVVGRAQDRAIGVEVLVDLALVPDVVAAGQDVHPAVEQLLGQGRGEARRRRPRSRRWR